jgi:hypothetical protein
MTYEDGISGRVDRQASEDGREAVFWTYDRVQERLIETVHAWWRMPGGGHWPFASDGPWHLVRTEANAVEVAEKALATAQMAHVERPRPLPLRRAEIAAMEEATEWITWVPEEKRVALVFGITKLAGGAKQIPWRRLSQRLGTVGSGGLEYRYSKAIELIANVLNAMAGVKFVSRKGAVATYPKEVRAIVEALKTADFRAGNVSSPVNCS